MPAQDTGAAASPASAPGTSKPQPRSNRLGFLFGCSPSPRIDVGVCWVSCCPADKLGARRLRWWLGPSPALPGRSLHGGNPLPASCLPRV